MFIVVPDVNVLVSKLNADRAGRSSTISQRLVGHLVAGSIMGEPVQIVLSFKMLDSYRDVLLRNDYPEALVNESISGLIEIMKFGPLGFDPHIVLGGSPDPALMDREDGGVLATAYAARATLLITNNLKDFAGQDAETFRTSRAKTPGSTSRELYCVIRSRPDGKELVVVHPADLVSWIERDFGISPQAIRRTFARTPRPQESSRRAQRDSS
jgi:predicted nucleic acid-binding protein